MSGAQLAQFAAEGLCLRISDNINPQPQVSYDIAMQMLLRGAAMAQNVPFVWSYIDKPTDGTLLLLYLPPNISFPTDGIRYMDTEVKYPVPAGPRELEVAEIKYGFVPNAGEPSASRVRRRYRLTKGGNPAFMLVHYTRGQSTHIAPNLMNQPVRAYPLQPIQQPAIFVAGEKQGQKVYPQGMVPPGGGGGPGPGPGPGMGMGMHGSGGHGPGGANAMPPATIGIGGMQFNQQQAMLAQANNNMELLERKRLREQERERQHQAAQRPPPQQRVVQEEDDSGDEIDQISTRTLALTRYKRNHDWMNEVFMQAAFGKSIALAKPKPSSVFVKDELEAKAAKLQAEVDELQTRAAQRRANRIRESQTGSNEAPDQIMHSS